MEEPIIDLVNKTRWETIKKAMDWVEERGLTEPHHMGDLHIGSTIQFWGGYNNDIRFQSRVTGFDQDGNIYVCWDCYWFPIQNDKTRDIKIIEDGEES